MGQIASEETSIAIIERSRRRRRDLRRNILFPMRSIVLLLKHLIDNRRNLA